MRKQTKIAVVSAAAALLAIGGAMTSFAAQGWVEEDGTWYYYDKDGNRVENEWKKSGDNWFWLDAEEGGAMATDKLVEDDDDTYYVDANGVMVTNTWVKVVNEDQDDDDLAEYHYYYMQSNGKAYKSSDNNTNTKFRTIDGKKYAFDNDGKMLYGWVKYSEPEMANNDTDWTDATYYLGSWEDGAMKTGWQRITVQDNEDDDEEKDFWFYFKSNGRKEFNSKTDDQTVKEKKINGKKYAFDERGVMTSQWTIASKASVSSISDISGQVESWKYFNSPEDGARVTKGWFKVVAPDDDNDNTFKDYDPSYGSFATTDAADETERWYYADGEGQLYSGVIKKIKGKYYGFRPEVGGKGAAMLTGLVFMKTDGNGNILKVYDDNVDSDELDHIINEEAYGDDVTTAVYSDPNVSLYYFGNNEDTDGALKTGTVNINLDGDSYSFYFNKSGGAEGKGKGVSGIDDEKAIYKYGLKIKADSDDKYRVVKVEGLDGSTTDIAGRKVKVTKIDSSDLRDVSTELGVNKDGDTVRGYVAVEDGKVASTWDAKYYLVNTSGTICKKKTAAKDGDDWYFYTNKDKNIVMYVNNKTLKGGNGHSMLCNLDNWDSVRTVPGTALNPVPDTTSEDED